MKKNIILLLGTIILLLILSEVGARIWAHFRPPQVYPDKGGYSYFPYLPYTPTPSYSDIDSIKVHNSRGFRISYEVKIPKPVNTFRIFCMGGSSTYDDYGRQKNEYTWSGRLEHYLNENSNGKKYEVINASAHNYTTYMNLIDYMTRCRDLQADMIIIYEGINELYFNGFKNVHFAHTNVFQPFDFDYHDYFYTLNNSPLTRFSMLFKLLYIKFKIDPLNLNVMSTKTVHHYELENLRNMTSDSLLTFKKGLEGFIAISSADNYKLVFLSQAYNFKNFEKYFDLDTAYEQDARERIRILIEETIRVSNLMKETSMHNNIPLLDMHELLNQQDELFVTMDAVHFSKEGSNFFALKLYSFLRDRNLFQ